jgi:transposase
VLDRDHNASINILNKGLNKLPQEMREVTLVENPKGLMKQEKVNNFSS